MASKFNTEFNYRYQVIGNTPWEKIKTLQGFLEGRVRTVALEEISHLKYQAKVSELKHLIKENGLEHKILELKAEIMEIESFQATEEEAFKLNQDEIKILNKLLKELFVIAEPTRIEGYTDEEMYEANAANEFTVGLIPKDTRILEGNVNPALEITLKVPEDNILDYKKEILKIEKEE